MAKKKEKNAIEINRIRVVLSEKNIQHKELAAMVKKAPGTITRICNNKSQPTLGLLREIALALDVNIKDLLNDTKK